MSSILETYICIFLSVSIVLLIIIGIFLIKLILELSKLTNNLNDITTIVKNDLKPTFNELQIALKNLNALIQETDRKVLYLKGILSKVLGAGSLALGSLKGLTGGFWKGVSTGMSIFKK